MTVPLPAGYQIRPLQEDDFDRGFLECLAQLTVVGDISPEQRQETFQYMQAHPDIFYIRVVTDDTGRIVGAGTLIIERKFIRKCGRVGHIEDIVVDKDQRGKNLGRAIIDHLQILSKELGCYKVILDCDKENVGFYEKCGFKEKGSFMAMYFP